MLPEPKYSEAGSVPPAGLRACRAIEVLSLYVSFDGTSETRITTEHTVLLLVTATTTQT